MSHSDLTSSDPQPLRGRRKAGPDGVEALENELLHLRRELSEQVRRADAALDADRRRIARDLHDTAGQFFTILRLELAGLSQSAGLTPDLAEGLARVSALAEDARRELDRLAWDIRPPEFTPGSIEQSIVSLLDDWSARSGLVFDTHLSTGGQRFPPAIESTLLRVLQEAVRNIVKHAGATRVGVILQSSPDDVRLTIEDNGQGFPSGDVASGEAEGHGLRGARERLELLGGTLEVETMPGHGSTLLAHIPV